MRVNPGFLALAVFYLVGGHGKEFVVAFLVITLHEVAHAVVADGYGLTVERMELWPFGGIARITGLSSRDRYVEAMVAVAGPLQNFVLAALTWLIGPYLPLNSLWLHDFIAVNLGIGALNLLPAAPLDGGRLARLYWAERVGYEQAERRVTAFGRWLAGGILVVTVLSFITGRPQLSLGVFGGFLYWGTQQSDKRAPYWIVRDLHLRPAWFRTRPVWAVDDFAIRADAPVSEVLKVMRPARYHRVVVLNAELVLLGTLYEEDLIRGLHEQGPSICAGDLLR